MWKMKTRNKIIIFSTLLFLAFANYLLIDYFFLRPPISDSTKRKIIDAILQSKPEEITSITIESSKFKKSLSLTNKTILINDFEKIKKICESLNNAILWAPNHPMGRWTCIMALNKKNGEIDSFSIGNTYDNRGTVIRIGSEVETGETFGFYRSDSLGNAIKNFIDKS